MKILGKKIDKLADKFNAIGVDSNKNLPKMGELRGTLPEVNPSSNMFLQISTEFKIYFLECNDDNKCMQNTSRIARAQGVTTASIKIKVMAAASIKIKIMVAASIKTKVMEAESPKFMVVKPTKLKVSNISTFFGNPSIKDFMDWITIVY